MLLIPTIIVPSGPPPLSRCRSSHHTWLPPASSLLDSPLHRTEHRLLQHTRLWLLHASLRSHHPTLTETIPALAPAEAAPSASLCPPGHWPHEHTCPAIPSPCLVPNKPRCHGLAPPTGSNPSQGRRGRTLSKLSVQPTRLTPPPPNSPAEPSFAPPS